MRTPKTKASPVAGFEWRHATAQAQKAVATAAVRLRGAQLQHAQARQQLAAAKAGKK